MRMIKTAGGLDFPSKAQSIGFLRSRSRMQHLEGDRPVQTEMTGAMNDPHAAAPDWFEQLVPADMFRDRRRFTRHLEGGFQLAKRTKVPMASIPHSGSAGRTFVRG
jgi:hypothetical protein